MMNRRATKLSLLFLTISGVVHSVTVEVPEWVNQVQTILANVSEIAEGFAKDAALYKGYVENLNDLINRFDRTDAERQQLFERLSGQINQLMQNLAQCHQDRMNSESQSAMIINDLKMQLIELRNQTNQEIEQLNSHIKRINDELEATRQAYATLITMDDTAAEALIFELVSIKQGYAAMVEQRNNFMATLDRFINRTNAHLDLDSKQLYHHVPMQPVATEAFPPYIPAN